ncbi:MAG TPA: YhdP family protein, partial [Gallionellaceae bacterium]|nr:YhdP family protein [Gallionellaceae bacterium]
SQLTRFALVLLLLLAFAAAGLVIALRHWVLPEIGQYHGRIVAAATAALGQPVEIDQIEADWHGIGPHLRLNGIRILTPQKKTALTLQQVDLVVSWMTLLSGELRFARVEIDRPELLVRRDVQGKLQVSGLALAEQMPEQDTGSGFANLLLEQSRIVVRDAQIAWLDEKRHAPLLVFRDVNLLIQNSWRHHRFAMRATPPAALATQLDVRGDLFGNTLDDTASWGGDLFTQLDYADVGAWKTWLPLPNAFKRGKGAVRGWVGVEDGHINAVTADLALENVQTRLAEDLPALEIRKLRGRAGWREVEDGFEVMSDGLTFKLYNGFELKPTSILLSLAKFGEQPWGRGEVRANALELGDFATLMEFLPLQPSFKQKFAAYAPQGHVDNLQAQWESEQGKSARYQLKARFNQLAMRRVGQMPGFSGLSGEVDGDDAGGTLSINAHKLKLEVPHFLAEPLAFDSLTAQSSWQSDGDQIEVNLSNASLVNDDLAGSVYGSYRTRADGPGRIDATLHLTRAELSRVRRYLPEELIGKETSAWLARALLDGHSNDASVRLQGDLNDFPFSDNRTGLFQVRAHVSDGKLDYAPGWPRLDNVDADFLMQGKQIAVTGGSATTLGARLKRVNVSLPDFMSDDLLLKIRGEQEGDIAPCLDFIQRSPVRGYLSGFTDDIKAHGNGRLALQLDIPLAGKLPLKVNGSYHFADHEVELAPYLPTLRKVNGDLRFSEAGVSAQNLVAQVLGGPATLALDTAASGEIHAHASGTTNLDALRKQVTLPLVHRLRGGAPWTLDVTAQNKLSHIVLDSTLQGLQSDLPAPFNKRAADSSVLHFEQQSQDAKHETLTLQYDKWLDARLQRAPDTGGKWRVQRGKVLLGSAARGSDKGRERDGVWLQGSLPLLALEGWSDVLGSGVDTGDSGLEIAGADVQIGKVTGYGSTVRDLRVRASSQDGVLTAQLASREINGEMSWDGDEQGKLVARLKNLNLGEGEAPAEAQRSPAAEAGRTATASPAALPALDVAIERLSVKGHLLGKLELQAQQQDDDYTLQQLRLTNPDAVLSADGRWKMQPGAEQSRLNLRLEIGNAGNLLGRYGYPDSVRNGSGKFEAALNWPGAPSEFDYAALDGTLKLDTGKGQFLQIEPGAGKLLSIMSLQALPKHLSLDFGDVFRKGFEFDRISGGAVIRHGLLQTDDFLVEGSSAKVAMNGQVDLPHESQNLRVKVYPAVGSSVSLLSFAAGPAVGVGVYLTNKLLRDPLDKLASFEYNVTGSWSDPQVEKVGAPPTPEAVVPN